MGIEFTNGMSIIANLVSNGGGGGSGTGSWYFYSDEGTINANPPVLDGNAVFTINTGSPILETFNPNKADGVTYLHFNVKDSNGTDYLSQFSALTGSGGTISIWQAGQKATYRTTTPNVFSVQDTGGKFFVIAAQQATQTATTATTFTYADPISIVFGS